MRSSKRRFDDTNVLPGRVGFLFASRGIFFELADGAASVTLAKAGAECDLHLDSIAEKVGDV